LKLQQQIDRLEELVEAAKLQQLKNIKRSKLAKIDLSREKRFTSMLIEKKNQRSNLETIFHSLENASTNQEIVNALKSSAAALQKSNQEQLKEDIPDLMEEIGHQMWNLNEDDKDLNQNFQTDEPLSEEEEQQLIHELEQLGVGQTPPSTRPTTTQTTTRPTTTQTTSDSSKKKEKVLA